MNSISQNIRYIPHDLNTKYHAVTAYRNENSSAYVRRKYHIHKSSLLDGIENLMELKNH